MTTPLGPLRRLLVLSTLVLAAASTALVPAQAQAPAAVTGADLPQVTRVDNLFPYLEGGKRFLLRSRTLEYADESCVFQSEGYPAESVRFANFVTEDRQSPFFQGKEDPTFVVYEFDSPASARTGYGYIARYVRSCQGPHRQDGIRFTVRKVHVPRLGDKTVGFRTIKTDEDGRPPPGPRGVRAERQPHRAQLDPARPRQRAGAPRRPDGADPGGHRSLTAARPRCNSMSTPLPTPLPRSGRGTDVELQRRGA